MNWISSAATSSRDGCSPSPKTISRIAHGLPCAPRPTITAAAPGAAALLEELELNVPESELLLEGMPISVYGGG
jgi:hypothetical protein